MTHSFEYTHTPLEGLPERDRELVAAAREAVGRAHAPITHFNVGSAARLADGSIATSSNFESPIGTLSTCAERRLLYSLPDDARIESFAIVSASDAECYPCGVCRQAMAEWEGRQGSPMRVIMAGAAAATVVEKAADLLPFTYTYADTL
jgi:cytidine deaminase